MNTWFLIKFIPCNFSLEVLATLTTDVGRILSKLHQVQPKGSSRFVYGVRIAHLALKHRQGKNHKMRIIIFIGSPIDDDEKEVSHLTQTLLTGSDWGALL